MALPSMQSTSASLLLSTSKLLHLHFHALNIISMWISFAGVSVEIVTFSFCKISASVTAVVSWRDAWKLWQATWCFKTFLKTPSLCALLSIQALTLSACRNGACGWHHTSTGQKERKNMARQYQRKGEQLSSALLSFESRSLQGTGDAFAPVKNWFS